MANKAKLREILAILSPDGTVADFKAFDEGVDKLKSGLKQKIQAKTLEDVNGQLRRVKDGMNLEPLLTAIKDIDKNFDTRIQQVASALADEVSKFDDLSKAEREENTGKLAESSGLVVSLRNELDTLKTQKDKEMGDVIEALKGIPSLRADNETTFNEIKTRLDALEVPDEEEPDLITPVVNRVEEVRSELISKIASTNHGDHANRNIGVAGNTSVLSKYTDINLIAGANVTITPVPNTTTKYTDITIAASGSGGGSVIGVPAGQNTQIQYNDNGQFGASSTFAWDKNASVFTAYGQTFLGQPGIPTVGTVFNTNTTDLNTNVIINSFQANGPVNAAGNVQALAFGVTDTGTNNIATLTGVNGLASKTGSGSVTTLTGVNASARIAGTAVASVLNGFMSTTRVQIGTTAITVNNFNASAAIVTGSIGASYGFHAAPQKVAGVTTGYGIGIDGTTDGNYFLGTVGVGVKDPGVGARLQIGLQGSVAGNLRMAGSIAGTVQLQPASVAGDWTMTLPIGTGNAGQYLQTDGNGITQWASVTASGGSGITRAVSVISVNTTAGNTANTDYVYFANVGMTVTLPTAIGNSNQYTVKVQANTSVLVAALAGQDIDGSTSVLLDKQYTALSFTSNNSVWGVLP